MNYYYYILSILLLLCGCKTLPKSTDKSKTYTMKDVIQIYLSVNSSYPYIAEDGDYWQTPEETIKKKGGDCEDKAILLQSLFLKKGIKSKIIIGETTKSEKLENYHAWNEVLINDKTYIVDATMGYFQEKRSKRHMFFHTARTIHYPDLSMKRSNLRHRLIKTNQEKIADSIVF